MIKNLLLALACITVSLPAIAQNKIDNRLGDSAEVLRQAGKGRWVFERL
jgi:SH3 domain-containing YSC84-like protein 1